jgi:hypothetical protein
MKTSTWTGLLLAVLAVGAAFAAGCAGWQTGDGAWSSGGGGHSH